jgi:hypothetical protein
MLRFSSFEDLFFDASLLQVCFGMRTSRIKKMLVLDSFLFLCSCFFDFCFVEGVPLCHYIYYNASFLVFPRFVFSLMLHFFKKFYLGFFPKLPKII